MGAEWRWVRAVPMERSALGVSFGPPRRAPEVRISRVRGRSEGGGGVVLFAREERSVHSWRRGACGVCARLGR